MFIRRFYLNTFTYMKTIFDVSLNNKELNWRHNLHDENVFQNVFQNVEEKKTKVGIKENIDTVSLITDKNVLNNCKPKIYGLISYSTICTLISLLCVTCLHIMIIPVSSPITIQLYILILSTTAGIFNAQSSIVKIHCYLLHLSSVVITYTFFFKNLNLLFITYLNISTIFALLYMKRMTITSKIVVFLAFIFNIMLCVFSMRQVDNSNTFTPGEYVMHVALLFANFSVYVHVVKGIPDM